jgi:hypothetical protein
VATELTPLTVTVTNPTSGYTWNISALSRNLNYSTVEPGGCEQASFHIPVAFVDRTLITPPFLQMFYQLRILDELGCVWIGRLEEIGLDIDENGGQWAITAYGYGVRANDQVKDVVSITKDDNSIYTSAAGHTGWVYWAMQNLMPAIQSYNITATGYTFAGAATLNNLTAGGLIAYMRAFGTSGQQPVQFTVYPSNDGTIVGTVRPQPTAADLRSRLQDFGKASFKASGRAYANRVQTSYQSYAHTNIQNSTLQQLPFPNGVAFVKTLSAVAGEFSNATDVAQLSSTLLNWATAIRLSAAGTYTTGGSTRFRDESSGQWNVTPRRVRAGQYMAISDMVTLSTGSTNLAFNNSFIIARTRWDEDSNTLTITPENFESAAERAWAQVRGTLMGRFTLQ